MSNIWSDYQKAIFDFPKSDNQHALIQSGPGCGKSSTMVEATNYISNKTLFLAFSAKIAGAIQNKVPNHVEARTFNAFGWKVCRNTFPNVELDENKTFNILKQFVEQEDLFYTLQGPMRRIVSILKNMNQTVTDNWRDCADRCGMELPDWKSETQDAFENVLPEVYEDSIRNTRYMDYDDQVFQPIFRDLALPRFSYVMVDESQDLNAVNIATLEILANQGTRLVMVGDVYQCQPTGTLISTLDKDNNIIEKPIQTLTRWDNVVSIQKGTREWRKNYIEEVASRQYKGQLIAVTATDESISYYTPNHRCLADFRMLKHYSCVYIMRKGNNFRIGKSSMYHEGYHIGVSARIKAEKATDAWILSVHDSNEDAYTQEQIISYKYNIPQTVFSANSNKHRLQSKIDKIWSEIGNNTDNATKCLEAFGRDIKYPLITTATYGLNRLMEVRACNLMDGCQVVKLNWEPRHRWETTHNRANLEDFQQIKVERIDYEGEVWSLKVNRDETYVANGIATHNSVFAFRGALVESMDILRETFGPQEFDLPLCYRCPEEVIKMAQRINPKLQSPNPNPNGKGFTKHIKLEEFHKIVKPGDFVISRTVLPLVTEVLKLNLKGIYAYVEGREVTETLFKIIDRVWYGRMKCKQSLAKLVSDYRKTGNCDSYDITDFSEEVRLDLSERIGRLTKEGKENIIDSLIETTDTLHAIADTVQNVPELIVKIEAIFKEPQEINKPAVRAMSIHKVKGLENPIVHMLYPEDIPHYRAVKSGKQWQLTQERNLKFVGDTRTQEGTYYVTKPVKI